MNINLDEAWSRWEAIDDAVGPNEPAALEAASLLIPQLIVEIQRLNNENTGLRENLTKMTALVPATKFDVEDEGDVIYDMSDDDSYLWEPMEFVVWGEGKGEITSYDPIESITEFGDKFYINEGEGCTYIHPKDPDEFYGFRKVRHL